MSESWWVGLTLATFTGVGTAALVWVEWVEWKDRKVRTKTKKGTNCE